MPATYYPAIIDRSASGFGVSFPDFPGCIANGDTVNEAALNAEAALALHVEAMVKDKDDLPAPSDLDAIEEVEGAEDVARLLIRVDTPAKVERVLITLDTGLLRAIDAVASNRSGWIADAARARLSVDAHRRDPAMATALRGVYRETAAGSVKRRRGAKEEA